MRVRSVCHIHSTYSYDGKVRLETLRDFLKEQGVQAVFMSEHTDGLTAEKAGEFIEKCRNLSDEKIIFVPGFESTIGNNHILVFGADSYFEDPGRIITENALKGAVVVWAHPHRSGYVLDEKWKKELRGYEIWNSQYDGKFSPRLRSLTLFKKSYSHLLSFGGLDLHRLSHFGGPELELETAGFSERELLSALGSGNFKIKGQKFEFNSGGNLVSGSNLALKVIGPLSTISIATLRKLSRILSRSKIYKSGHIKEFIRKKI